VLRTDAEDNMLKVAGSRYGYRVITLTVDELRRKKQKKVRTIIALL
jgi:hypothetical protein